MKSLLWRGALMLALLATAGALIVVSGLVPLKASSGHWTITEWILDFTKRRAVNTQSLGISGPPLDDARLVVRGGAYYDIGCRPCHGAVEPRQPRIAAQMTPHPVFLPTRIQRWNAEELFYIIKHGIKFTGMPAWPARQRDDEVWAVVAFLKRLPQLDATEYARLTQGESNAAMPPPPGLSAMSQAARRAVNDNCARCHGADGMGRDGAAPAIAGQKPRYLVAALDAYARGARRSGMMEPIAAALSRQTMNELAQYYAALPRVPASLSQNVAAVERGRKIIEGGIPQKKVPHCAECHGPGDHPRNPFYPDLAGQHAEYLVLQLQLFKSGSRGGSSYAHLMRHVAPHLTEQQMADVGAYYSGLNLSPSSGKQTPRWWRDFPQARPVS